MKLLFEGLLMLILLLFLVKSYGKLRNCFLKVCWLCFCVSVAVLKQFVNTRTARLFYNNVSALQGKNRVTLGRCHPQEKFEAPKAPNFPRTNLGATGAQWNNSYNHHERRRRSCG